MKTRKDYYCCPFRVPVNRHLSKRLREEFRDLHWSVSFTTREMRDGEVDGKHYFYISKEEFLKKKDQGDFIEWAKVHGNLLWNLKRLRSK